MDITDMRQPILSPEAIIRQADDLLDSLLDYKELMLGYSSAMRQVRTKLEILNTEFEVKYRRNPISSIQTRLKSQPSIMQKMARKGLPLTVESIERSLNDIAGVRVICCYADDIYRLADALISQSDVELVARKDYIAAPKPNGYRSLHLIVSVPVYFAQSTKNVRVEVQIRTIAMDFWASLEHQIKYKKNAPGADAVIARLKSCADVIAETDLEMQALREEMDELSDERTETEAVFEKLKRFDVSLG
ncbi:MAG: GTP pyrophosphokinase family protein [Oscillospiraceae bacterium]|nr:GTP pyrophosphokinase family protein [Oscillospiraceae bacterium]